jgi:hypothetical protein
LAKKTILENCIDSSVNAGVTDIIATQIIPAGRSVKLRTFGGCIPNNPDGSFIALQWGSGSSWATIRVIVQEQEFSLMKEFIGDNNKLFRVVRYNGGSSPKKIVAWYNAIIV